MFFTFKNMNLNVKDAVMHLTFPAFEQYNFLKHSFSTRIGGVSSGNLASMNLGFNRGDKEETLIENYKRFCNAVNISENDIVCSAQSHGTKIYRVHKNQRGQLFSSENKITNVDGLITDEPYVALTTFHADCTPVYFIDVNKRVIGLAHAGWRGTVGGICIKMIEQMVKIFKCNVTDIICGIGPCIHECCFEVNYDVAKKFLELNEPDVKEFIKKKNNSNKFSIDLSGVNKKMLIHSGVEDNNIILSGICTSCSSDILFSHRKSLGDRGTMIAIMELVKG